MKVITDKSGDFMNSGEVGGWRNKMTIGQAQRLYNKAQRELSTLKEIPNIMEYGKAPLSYRTA